jgi:hypothetical protein
MTSQKYQNLEKKLRKKGLSNELFVDMNEEEIANIEYGSSNQTSPPTRTTFHTPPTRYQTQFQISMKGIPLDIPPTSTSTSGTVPTPPKWIITTTTDQIDSTRISLIQTPKNLISHIPILSTPKDDSETLYEESYFSGPLSRIYPIGDYGDEDDIEDDMLEDEQVKKDITLAIDFGSSNVTVCYGTPQARHFLKSDDGQEQFIPPQAMLMLDSDLKRNEFKNVKWFFGTDAMAKINVVKETDV